MTYPPVALSPPPSIIIIVIVHKTVFFFRILKLVVYFRESFLLVLFILFKICLQAFQRRFAAFFPVGLHVVESGWDDLFVCVIVDTRKITRMVVRVREYCRGIDQAKVIWGKSVTH